MAKHFTFREREVLYRLNREKRPKAEIAAILGRNRSTIYRELQRNVGNRGYRPKQAQRKADQRRLACRGEAKMNDPKLKSHVVRSLKKGWSPDQIAGRATRGNSPRAASRGVSHQTIYNWLSAEAPELRNRLRRGRRRSQPETRGKIPPCVRIEGRPPAVAAKRRYGDWEGDTVVSPGRRSGLVTMVERKSQYLRVRKTSSLKSAPTLQAAYRGLRDPPEGLRRTMTLDNGKEFTEHGRLTERLGLDVYFAQPYASWQRGLNENTNGLLRQFFPKGTDFARISHRQLARVEKLLNERPRKNLGYRTPDEVFHKKTVAIGV
jgi:transposase, IS30 family